MTAVAVWDHQPTAEELLQARLARGWTPRASAMQDGARVLGYASCVVGRGNGHRGHEGPGDQGG